MRQHCVLLLWIAHTAPATRLDLAKNICMEMYSNLQTNKCSPDQNIEQILQNAHRKSLVSLLLGYLHPKIDFTSYGGDFQKTQRDVRCPTFIDFQWELGTYLLFEALKIFLYFHPTIEQKYTMWPLYAIRTAWILDTCREEFRCSL